MGSSAVAYTVMQVIQLSIVLCMICIQSERNADGQTLAIERVHFHTWSLHHCSCIFCCDHLHVGMSALRHALRHAARLQESVLLRSLPVAEPASACAPASQAQQVRSFAASSACSSPTHIEDEPYCRQRQLLVLGNRVPVLAPDSWVAPNAVVIGDVDLYDKVSECGGRPSRCFCIWQSTGFFLVRK